MADVLSLPYLSRSAVGGYTAGAVANKDNGFTAELTANEGNTGLKALHLDVTFENNNRARIRITDPANQRFEVPESISPILDKVCTRAQTCAFISRESCSALERRFEPPPLSC